MWGSPLYHFPSSTPKLLCPSFTSTPPLSLSSCSQLAWRRRALWLMWRGEMMRVGGGGSRCSWSLIVWLVGSGFPSRVLSSRRGERWEEISDGTSPPCGLLTGRLLSLARELLIDHKTCVYRPFREVSSNTWHTLFYCYYSDNEGG